MSGSVLWFVVGVAVGQALWALSLLIVFLLRRRGGRRVPGASERMSRLIGTYTIRPMGDGSSFSYQHGEVWEDSDGRRTHHPLINYGPRIASGDVTAARGESGLRLV